MAQGSSAPALSSVSPLSSWADSSSATFLAAMGNLLTGMDEKKQPDRWGNRASVRRALGMLHHLADSLHGQGCTSVGEHGQHDLLELGPGDAVAQRRGHVNIQLV